MGYPRAMHGLPMGYSWISHGPPHSCQLQEKRVEFLYVSCALCTAFTIQHFVLKNYDQFGNSRCILHTHCHSAWLGMILTIMLQMTERLASMLTICLISLWKPCLAGDPAVDVFGGHRPQEQQQNQHQQRVDGRTQDFDNEPLACTLNELLPRSCNRKSSEWSEDYVVEPPYNCTCAAMKAR